MSMSSGLWLHTARQRADFRILLMEGHGHRATAIEGHGDAIPGPKQDLLVFNQELIANLEGGAESERSRTSQRQRRRFQLPRGSVRADQFVLDVEESVRVGHFNE